MYYLFLLYRICLVPNYIKYMKTKSIARTCIVLFPFAQGEKYIYIYILIIIIIIAYLILYNASLRALAYRVIFIGCSISVLSNVQSILY